MIQQFKLWFNNNRTWIYTVQYIFYSVLLLILVSLVDLNYAPIDRFIPDFLYTKVSLARTVLTTLAGSLLTITTFTFSTILTVLNMYATNYTPRSIQNFTNEKITMKILGIYIGGFFYCVSALLFVRDASDERLVISGTIAIFYSIFSIIYFVIFVQKVLASIQSVNIIGDIFQESLPAIEEEIEERTSTKEYAVEEGWYDLRIKCPMNGYLSVIDFEGLTNALKDYKGILNIQVKIGDYLIKDLPVAKLSLNEQPDDEEKLQESLTKYFLLQDSKVQASDYRYGISKLVEVAIRGMSSGIKDPNTAVHCVRKISILLSKLAAIDDYHILKAQGDSCEIFYTSYSLDEDLYNAFFQIIHYGHTDVSITRGVLEGLYAIYSLATDKNKKIIEQYAAYIYDIIKETFHSPLDLDYLNAVYYRINPEDADIEGEMKAWNV
ncbi:MAG: DUF2254 family protein [Tissierellia bacterium]|nr:DUF2254 family protein [Tissierellia bacterium]